MMTVAELIAALSALPGETRVLVDGYESGMDDPRPPRLVTAYPAYPERGILGMYDDYESWSEEGQPRFDAVLIPR